MGSGSSKSKGRAIQICNKQLLAPPVESIGTRTTTVICQQMKGDNSEETCMQRNSKDLTGKSRFLPVDPDLQLIEDILADSEDCFFWPAKQMVASSQHGNTSQGSPSQVPQNQSRGNGNLQTKANKPVCGYEEHQHQAESDNCDTTAPVKVLDIENNNLPKFANIFLASEETSTPITYDDVEEALMDSIEEEYSYIQPASPLH